jgi:hypothetical protein
MRSDDDNDAMTVMENLRYDDDGSATQRASIEFPQGLGQPTDPVGRRQIESLSAGKRNGFRRAHNITWSGACR